MLYYFRSIPAYCFLFLMQGKIWQVLQEDKISTYSQILLINSIVLQFNILLTSLPL